MCEDVLIPNEELKYVLKKYNNFLQKNEINNNILNSFNSVKVKMSIDDDGYELIVLCNVIFNNDVNDKLHLFYRFSPDSWYQFASNAYINKDQLYEFNNQSSYDCWHSSDNYKKYDIPEFCENYEYNTLIEVLAEEVRPKCYKKFEDKYYGFNEDTDDENSD